MFIRNTSRYPTTEVRELVKLATQEIDMRRVCVNVKNAGHTYCAGMAYQGVPSISNAPPSSDYLVTLRLGPQERFPAEHRYPGKADHWPTTVLADWREALVHIAAHEALHIEQYREGYPRSEMKCERYAERVLTQYRKETAPEEAVA